MLPHPRAGWIADQVRIDEITELATSLSLCQLGCTLEEGIMRKLGYALMASVALLSAGTDAQSSPAKKPNIVILLADDWGFTDVGSFGGEMRTPNLDALAKSGVRFSNFHVAASCSPTRAMLQTGVSSHRAGLGNMPETMPPEHLGKPGYDSVLNNNVVTIADVLRADGYRTYMTGKWHLGHDRSRLPVSRGYDRSFALSQSGADNFEEKPNLLLYDKADWTEDGKPAHLPKDYYSSRFIVDKMIQYLDSGEASGKPFLASVNFIANHIPVQAPDADIAAYKGRYDKGWTALRAERRNAAVAAGVMPASTRMVRMATTADWDAQTAEQKQQRSGAMEAYGGMATAMDREVGRLIEHLKAKGEYENTIFVFLSDNGAEATDPMRDFQPRTAAKLYYDMDPAKQGQRGSFTAIGAGFASAASSPLRGYKFTASEGGLRVPLIVAWPGNKSFTAGKIANGFAHVTDIAPTLLSLTGLPVQSGSFNGRAVEAMRGTDLTPMLTGKKPAVHAPDQATGYELSGNAALFKGDYKIVKNWPPYGDGQWRLYNIVTDPGETVDVSKEQPELFAAMQADYAAYAKSDQVLDMPKGYTAPEQIVKYSRANVMLPRLKAHWYWPVGLVVVLVGGVWAWRRRRKSVQNAIS